MKITETERVFCIEITEKEYRKALVRDERAIEHYDGVSGRYSYSGTLLDVVCKVSGVREVIHDPMFGPFVHVRVESEDQQAMAETLENVKREIAKYVR